MKWDRDKALLEALRFAYEANFGGLRDPGRIKAWNRLKKHLFWDIRIRDLTPYECLEEIQGALREFFDEYFMPILDIWHSSPWKDIPGNEVDRLARELLSEGKVKTYEDALKRVEKDNPQLWKTYLGRDWRKYLPESQSTKRLVYVSMEAFRYREEVSSLKEWAVEQAVKLLAIEPIPLSKLYRCRNQDCNKWSINTRKSRKHWFCSKRCYDRWAKREERSTPEGREQYRKRQKARYRAKVLGEA